MRDHLGQFQLSSNMHFSKGVLCMDDCVGAMNWTKSGTGGDDLLEHAAAAAFFGATGLHLKTRTTDAAQNDSIVAQKNFDFPASGLLVYRAKLNSPSLAAANSISLQTNACAADTLNSFSLNYNPAGPALYYIASGGNPIELTGANIEITDNQWQTIEIVLNLLTMTAISVTWCGHTYDLSGVGMFIGIPDSATYTQLRISLITTAAAPAELYADAIYAGEFLDI